MALVEEDVSSLGPGFQGDIQNRGINFINPSLVNDFPFVARKIGSSLVFGLIRGVFNGGENSSIFFSSSFEIVDHLFVRTLKETRSN